MEKIYIIASIARQVDGDLILVRVEKAFKDVAKADSYKANRINDFVLPDGKKKVSRLNTSNGLIDCFCEVGAFEVELE